MLPNNIHGTAIIIGTTGLLFVGPSGIGKSTIAFTCMVQARRIGLFSALISDDQVLVFLHDGHVVARPPATIAGLLELRGSGIITTEILSPALLHYAVLPVQLQTAERLPPEEENFGISEEVTLPLVRVSAAAPDPLAILSAFIPFNGKPPMTAVTRTGT